MRLPIATLGLSVSIAAAGAAPRTHHHRHFAVLVAGSTGYYNYRHQADVCHAHAILKQHGIPEENIILFSTDDVAHDPENPIPGTLFNHPDRTGKGHDVYKDCMVDYRGDDVTVHNFEAVLTGNASAVPKGLPVLDSSEDDFVFLNFVDHGESGAVSFPNENLKREKFHRILKRMKERKMFKSMVVYIEACESGSMFDDDNDIPPGIFIVTAANATESSWGTYCPSGVDPDADMVDGKHIGTCLGDLFSVNWMEDSELPQVEGETVGQQVDKITELTTRSHVQKYGDEEVAKRRVTDFQGMTDDQGWTELPNKSEVDRSLVLMNNPSNGSIATAAGLLSEFLGRTIGVSAFAAQPAEEDAQLLARRERLAHHKTTSSVPAKIIEINNAFVRLYRESQHAGNYEAELKAVNDLIVAAQARAEQLKKRMGPETSVADRSEEVDIQHPLGILKTLIDDHFHRRFPQARLLAPSFIFDSPPSPVIRSEVAFDELLIPKGHPSRSRSDTFYISDTDTEWLLRPQATAHQPEMLCRVAAAGSPVEGAVWSADVYRKDEIDRYHYPVFHQVDGLRLFSTSEASQAMVIEDLKKTLEGLMESLFGAGVDMRWDSTVTFPFTDPSLEMEIFYNGKWGGRCSGLLDDHRDRSTDKRFLSQFADGELKKFVPFSNYPPVFKDISFWIDDDPDNREALTVLPTDLSVLRAYVDTRVGE
ncbi:hypothetical protein FOZ63_033001 [Perkinsus olseni]|uniref:legumain n=1 Tax=Perkinsus olseni TaxID=32597 RepID=A0A7J6R7E1_PEROL|nr:hypothetical protein FOZ63_033001 [Perkinsus olseni]